MKLSTTISIIVATSTNNCIGKGGDLPWKLSRDLTRFKELTTGHPIIMGRKTYESIGQPLPNRLNIIITRDREYKAREYKAKEYIQKDENQKNPHICYSLEEAITYASQSAQDTKESAEIFIIGGAQIYQTALPYTNKIYLTEVHAQIQDGDTFFPEINQTKWKLENLQEYPQDKKNQHPTSFKVLTKI